MSIAAAVRINSPDERRVIEHAVAFSRQQNAACFVISVVSVLPYGAIGESDQLALALNFRLIEISGATPVIQEGDDIAQTLVAFGRSFGIATLFVQSGRPRFLGRSVAEQLLYLNPPFDVIVVPSQ